jgi:hypothetical protein
MSLGGGLLRLRFSRRTKRSQAINVRSALREQSLFPLVRHLKLLTFIAALGKAPGQRLDDVLNGFDVNQFTGYIERARDFYCLAFKGPRSSWVVEHILGLRR